MARFVAVLILGGLFVAGGGCVVGNTITAAERPAARQAVVIDGQVYVIDVRTGEVSTIAPEAMAEAKPFEPIDKGDKCEGE